MLEIANCFRDPGLRLPAPYHTRLHAIPNRKSQSFVDSVFAGHLESYDSAPTLLIIFMVDTAMQTVAEMKTRN